MCQYNVICTDGRIRQCDADDDKGAIELVEKDLDRESEEADTPIFAVLAVRVSGDGGVAGV